MVGKQPTKNQYQTCETPPRSGWGAVWNRIETRGTWSLHESSLHINCLELLAATYVIKAFTNSPNNAHVLIQMDNTSAIAYLNKMGGPKQVVPDKHAHTH